MLREAGINDAWSYMRTMNDLYPAGRIKKAFALMGIIECELCIGSGYVEKNQFYHRTEKEVCPLCKGNKWIRRDSS